MFELSVVIPTRNDVDRLEGVLEELHRIVISSGLSTEVVVVDDGSIDGTLDLAKRLSADLALLHLTILEMAHPRAGFGALLRFGVAYATGRFVSVIAADGTDPLEVLPGMVAKLRSGAHLVVCSRYTGPDYVAGVDRRFRLYQRLYRGGIRILLGQHISDSTNGFRAFDRRFAQALGLSSNRFSICPELTFKTLLVHGRLDYVDGQPRRALNSGVEKFKLPFELAGYAAVLGRAALHRLGIRWF
jgi:polyisoprenyl-phosphate glycosyltransferase